MLVLNLGFWFAIFVIRVYLQICALNFVFKETL